jgi:branched-chain amino acid transport system permease protein
MTQGPGAEARRRRAAIPTSWYVTLGVVAALALLPRVIVTPYYLHLLIFVLLYVGLASAWNLMGGFAGQLSLGHAGFFGIGAYTSTLLSMHFGLSPWIGMLAGMLLAMVAGTAIGYPCFRLKGPFFALATLAFGGVLRIVAIAWVDLTQGSNGLSIPFRPGFKNMMWQGKEMFFYLILAYALATVVIAWRIERSRMGHYLIALKEDDSAARMLGIDTTRYKLYATLISAALTAAGGTFYAQYIGYIEPYYVFEVNQSVQFALICIIGGMGTVLGPVLGAFIMIPLTEVLRAILGEWRGGSTWCCTGSS